MKKSLLAISLFALLMIVSGCGGMVEICGVTKPQPRIIWANVFRASSSSAVQTNRTRSGFWVTDWSCYRMGAQGSKVYLDFQYERAEATSDGGRAIYVLSSECDEALGDCTYFILVGIGAEVYDYSCRAQLTDEERQEIIFDKIVSTREAESGQKLSSSELLDVHKLAALIDEERQKGNFKPVFVGDKPVTRSRDSTPTTNAYDAGLWQCNPDGSCCKVL